LVIDLDLLGLKTLPYGAVERSRQRRASAYLQTGGYFNIFSKKSQQKIFAGFFEKIIQVRR
jgi:hypothetical protein